MPRVNILCFYRMCSDAAIYLEVCINFLYIREMINSERVDKVSKIKMGESHNPGLT